MPSRPLGNWAATSACWSASHQEPMSGQPGNWPPLHGNIATVLPDRAERYFSTSLMYGLASHRTS